MKIVGGRGGQVYSMVGPIFKEKQNKCIKNFRHGILINDVFNLKNKKIKFFGMYALQNIFEQYEIRIYNKNEVC